MARLSTRQQILLLVSAASVPVALGVTAWPPGRPVHELVVVRMPVPVRVEIAAPVPEIAPVLESVEPATAEAAPTAAPTVVEPAGFRYGHDFLWVANDIEDGQAFAVLSYEPDAAWAAGPPRATGGHGLVTRPLDEAAVPEALRALVGERLQLHGGKQPACTGVVGPLRLVAQAEGDFGMLLDEGEILADAIDFWERPEDEQRALAAAPIWEQGRRLLVAPLAVDDGCDGVPLVWARPVASGDVEQLEGRAMRKRAGLIRRFLALPELVELSQEFDQYVAMMRENEAQGEGEAEAVAEVAPLEVIEPTVAIETAAIEAPAADGVPRLSDRVKGRQWRTDDGTVAFVTLITEGQELEPEACSGIPTPRWAVAAVAADGEPQPFQVGPYGMPSDFFDIDGDGRWELLMLPGVAGYEPQLMTVTPEGLQTLTTLSPIPFFGCPC